MTNQPRRRSGWALLALATIPAIIAAFVIWATTETLASRQPVPRWLAGSIRWIPVFVPPAIYFVIDRLWVKGNVVGTIARTFVLLLLVFLPLGIATPSMEGVFQRQRQKDTMVRMQSIATKLENYAENNGTYPTTDDIASLAGVPREDAWDHPFVLHSRPKSYIVISYGFGGVPDVRSPDEYKPETTLRPEDDIVFRDGAFVRYPEAVPIPR